MIASFGGNSSNGCRGVTVSLATLVALLGASTPQSTVPIVQLRVPDAMLSEPFSEVAGIRELSDGRVLVVDALELKVWKVDLSKDSRIPIGRNGRGPGEYEWPIRLFAFPNDETAIVDDASRTIQFFSPDGTVTRRVMRTTSVSSLASAVEPIQADADGRLYGLSVRVQNDPRGGILIPDSGAIVRWRAGHSVLDTVGFLRISVSDTRRSARGSSQTRRAFIGFDQWAVSGNGTFALVMSNPFKVAFINGDKHHTGPAITYEKIAVTQEHKQRFLREQGRPKVYMLFGRKGAPNTFQVYKPPNQTANAWQFPEYLPPFLEKAVSFDGDGTLWVKRTTPAPEPPTFDLIDSSGRVVRRILFPQQRKLVGFGRNSIYAIRVDEYDLQHLERYRIP